jgi:hypothetical protein
MEDEGEYGGLAELLLLLLLLPLLLGGHGAEDGGPCICVGSQGEWAEYCRGAGPGGPGGRGAGPGGGIQPGWAAGGCAWVPGERWLPLQRCWRMQPERVVRAGSWAGVQTSAWCRSGQRLPWQPWVARQG